MPRRRAFTACRSTSRCGEPGVPGGTVHRAHLVGRLAVHRPRRHRHPRVHRQTVFGVTARATAISRSSQPSQRAADARARSRSAGRPRPRLRAATTAAAWAVGCARSRSHRLNEPLLTPSSVPDLVVRPSLPPQDDRRLPQVVLRLGPLQGARQAARRGAARASGRCRSPAAWRSACSRFPPRAARSPVPSAPQLLLVRLMDSAHDEPPTGPSWLSTGRPVHRSSPSGGSQVTEA